MKCIAWIRWSHFLNAYFLPNSSFQRISSVPCWSVIEIFCYHFLLCCFIMKILPSLCCAFLLISLSDFVIVLNGTGLQIWSVRTLKRHMGKPTAFNKAKNVPSLPPLTLSLWSATFMEYVGWKGSPESVSCKPEIISNSTIYHSFNFSSVPFFLLLTLIIIAFCWFSIGNSTIGILLWESRENIQHRHTNISIMQIYAICICPWRQCIMHQLNRNPLKLI